MEGSLKAGRKSMSCAHASSKAVFKAFKYTGIDSERTAGKNTILLLETHVLSVSNFRATARRFNSMSVTREANGPPYWSAVSAQRRWAEKGFQGILKFHEMTPLAGVKCANPIPWWAALRPGLPLEDNANADASALVQTTAQYLSSQISTSGDLAQSVKEMFIYLSLEHIWYTNPFWLRKECGRWLERLFANARKKTQHRALARSRYGDHVVHHTVV